MLKEIVCDGFREDGHLRGPISFNDGLNVVLGNPEGENAIGKSTFLSIVDYCFGGTAFEQENIKNYINQVYPIKFTFKFYGVEYSFRRQEDERDIVWKCSRDYTPQEKITLQEFNDWLKEQYRISLIESSFRNLVGTSSRIANKNNCNPERPLDSAPKQPAKSAIDSFEKKFSSYNIVSRLKEAAKSAKEKKSVFKKAMSYDFLPSHIPSNTEYKENESKIQEFEREIERLKENADVKVSEDEFEANDEASAIAAEIASLRRVLNALNTKKNIVMQNIKDGQNPSESDLSKLAHFFPGIEMKNIEEVVFFHNSISAILKKEMNDQVSDYQTQIEGVEGEILRLENKLREIKGPLRVSPDVYEAVAELRQSIRSLKNLNKRKLEHDEIEREAKETEQERIKEEQRVLNEIQQDVNERQQQLCERVYGKGAPFCELSFPKIDSYSFSSEINKSTGFRYANLLLHDLVLLTITEMPCVIHDSLLFKNIGDSAIDEILSIYNEIKQKQVFIAFDKKGSYRQHSQDILETRKVLQLDDGTKALYGSSWSKRKSVE